MTDRAKLGRVVNEIAKALQENSSYYKFGKVGEKDTNEKYLDDIIDVLNSSTNSNMITNNINKTEIADEAILMIARENGIGTNSIHDFEEVTMSTDCTADMKIDIKFNFTMKRPVKRVSYQFKLNDDIVEMTYDREM